MFFSSLAKSAMNWCLVAVFFSLVLGSSVRKTLGRLSRDCLEEYRGAFVINYITFSMVQVLTHFLEFLKICPKMFPFFAKMIDLCLLTQKNQTLWGVIGRNIALWQNLWVGVGRFERRSSSARASPVLCGRFQSTPVAYSWIAMRRALRKRRLFDFVPSYLNHRKTSKCLTG